MGYIHQSHSAQCILSYGSCTVVPASIVHWQFITDCGNLSRKFDLVNEKIRSGNILKHHSEKSLPKRY